MSTTEEKIGGTESELTDSPEAPSEAASEIAAPAPAKKKMSGEVKLFIGILVGAVILGGAAIGPTLFQKPPKPPVYQVDRPDINRAFLIPAGSHIKGDPNAKHTLVEFSDFQCPSCKNAIPQIEKALKDQSGRLNVVFRHFQAALRHKHSKTLGLAAEAAGQQGKFFEMGDKLFASQEKYEAASPEEVQDIIMKAAGELELDMSRFKQDLKLPQLAKKYEADQAAAEKAGLTSTPSFFFVPPTGKPTAFSTTTDMAWFVADAKNYK